MRQHFQQLEAGEVTDYGDLLRKCFESQAAALEDAPLYMSLDDIPTRVTVEWLALEMKSGKAPGLDSVGASALKNVMCQSSAAVYHLFFKSWMCAAEPLGFKEEKWTDPKSTRNSDTI